MEWTLLTQEQYVTTLWSGGTTTQLAIAPEGAVYADRDFLWRLSSAKVELPHSDFTPLPDYNRLISIVQGEMELKIGDGDRSPLQPLQVRAFDGGVLGEVLRLQSDDAQGGLRGLRPGPEAGGTFLPYLVRPCLRAPEPSKPHPGHLLRTGGCDCGRRDRPGRADPPVP